MPPSGHGFIEGDRADFLGVRVLQPRSAVSPATLEWRQLETRLTVLGLGRNQRRLTGQRQADLDHSTDVLRGEAKFLACLPILLHERLNLLLQVPLELEHLADRLGVLLGLLGVERGTASEHRLFDLLGDDGADLAEVFRMVSILSATRIRNSRSASNDETGDLRPPLASYPLPTKW